MKFFSMRTAVCCFILSGAANAQDPEIETGGVIHNYSMIYTIYIWRSLPNNQGEYKALGPNCSTPQGEDWDFGAIPNNIDPNNGDPYWYKCWYQTNYYIAYYDNDTWLGNHVFWYGLGDLFELNTWSAWPLELWVPTTNVPIPTNIYPISNAVTINPMGPAPLSPFMQIPTAVVDENGAITTPFIHPIPPPPTVLPTGTY